MEAPKTNAPALNGNFTFEQMEKTKTDQGGLKFSGKVDMGGHPINITVMVSADKLAELEKKGTLNDVVQKTALKTARAFVLAESRDNSLEKLTLQGNKVTLQFKDQHQIVDLKSLTTLSPNQLNSERAQLIQHCANGILFHDHEVVPFTPPPVPPRNEVVTSKKEEVVTSKKEQGPEEQDLNEALTQLTFDASELSSTATKAEVVEKARRQTAIVEEVDKRAERKSSTIEEHSIQSSIPHPQDNVQEKAHQNQEDGPLFGPDPQSEEPKQGIGAAPPLPPREDIEEPRLEPPPIPSRGNSQTAQHAPEQGLSATPASETATPAAEPVESSVPPPPPLPTKGLKGRIAPTAAGSAEHTEEKKPTVLPNRAKEMETDERRELRDQLNVRRRDIEEDEASVEEFEEDEFSDMDTGITSEADVNTENKQNASAKEQSTAAHDTGKPIDEALSNAFDAMRRRQANNAPPPPTQTEVDASEDEWK